MAVAVALAGSYSSNSTPSLGTSICCGGDTKKTKKQKSVWIHLKGGRGKALHSLSLFHEPLATLSLNA